MSKTKWIKQRNILAFPYAWQYPAKTEEWAYLRCLADLPNNRYIQVICFPWATLVDLLRSGQREKAEVFLDALRVTLPRMTLLRVTICQHIYMRDLLPFFRQLKITDVFWTHALINEPALDGIRIHPFPLYPVRCAGTSVEEHESLKPLSQRRYLYSFVGAYDPACYLTPVRQWLFDLTVTEGGLIEQRDAWHYGQHVYGEQVAGVPMQAHQLQQHKQASESYEAVLRETVFCLCPSGSGPNSIRLWEALGFGCVPIILSDTLQLPGNMDLWREAALQVPECEARVKALPAMLRNLSLDQFSGDAAQILWRRYGLNDFIYDICRLAPEGNVSYSENALAGNIRYLPDIVKNIVTKHYDPKKLLVSLHIPKCAGTSFSKVLQAWFEEHYFAHYHDEKQNLLPEKIANEDLIPGLCIHGHFNHPRGEGVEDYYPGAKQLITIIRDPFDLHVSTYFYVKKEAAAQGAGAFRSGKKHPIVLNNWTLSEYLEQSKKSYLCNFLPKDIALGNYREILMTRFLYIGITEKLQHSVNSLAMKLGFPRIEVPHANKADWEEEIPPGAREAFEANNKLEVLIYNFVKQIN